MEWDLVPTFHCEILPGTVHERHVLVDKQFLHNGSAHEKSLEAQVN